MVPQLFMKSLAAIDVQSCMIRTRGGNMARPKSKDQQVWFRIDPEIEEKALELAVKDGRSLSNWVRQLVERAIKARAER